MPDTAVVVACRSDDTTCFETFPFPEGLTPADSTHQRTEALDGGALIPADLAAATRPHAEAIARAARRLCSLRDAWLNLPDWTLQAQVVLLSAADAPPPVSTWELTQAMWRGGSPELVAALLAAGVHLVIRPGVDGAVLGVVGLKAGAVPTLLDAIRSQCQAFGCVFRECAESGL